MSKLPSGVRGDMAPRWRDEGVAEFVVRVRFSPDDRPAATSRTDNIVHHAISFSSRSANGGMATRRVAIDALSGASENVTIYW